MGVRVPETGYSIPTIANYRFGMTVTRTHRKLSLQSREAPASRNSFAIISHNPVYPRLRCLLVID